MALLGATNLWFYALFWGWQIAAWVIVLLLVHELGHAIAYKSFGLGVARIGFVPFLGAYAMSKTAPESAWVNAALRARRAVRSAASAARCCGGTATRPAPT